MRRLLLLLVLLAGAAVCRPAWAAWPEVPLPRGCVSEYSPACAKAYEEGRLRLYGAPSLETLATRGVQVRRVFVTSAWRVEVFALTFAYAPKQPPKVELTVVTDRGVRRISAPISIQTWDELLMRSAFFDRDRVEGPSENEEDMVISTCHGDHSTIEAIDFDSENPIVRRASAGECATSLAGTFVQDAFALAVSALPQCTSLQRNDLSPRGVLSWCARLDGDYAAAAKAFGSVWAFAVADESQPGDFIIAQDAVLHW